MRVLTLTIASILVLSLYLLFWFSSNFQNIEIGGIALKAKIANTLQEQTRGLAGRHNLNDREGMLFVYNQPTEPRFWMKGMLIPIDIIWIANNRVIGIENNIQPDGGTIFYRPPSPIDYVLEVSSGWSERNNINVGDQVIIDTSSKFGGIL